MTTVLCIDSSARPGRSDETRHGSHSRRLTARFLERWRRARQRDIVIGRDVGIDPPRPVTGRWIQAAFTGRRERAPWMRELLAESDALIDELMAADIIVAGVPMYNFGVPAQFKAYIDNIVRVGRTFGFDRTRTGEPYWPLVPQGKTLVVLSSRGDHGYGPGGRLEHMNNVERGIAAPFAYIGITDLRSVAVEFDEFADARLEASLAAAESALDALVDELIARLEREQAA